MTEFDQIEINTWKRFAREQGVKLPLFAILSFLLSFSEARLGHPILFFLGLTVLSGYVDYGLKIGPNLFAHASMKRSSDHDYRATVENELAQHGLAKLLNENWFVGERKRRMKQPH